MNVVDEDLSSYLDGQDKASDDLENFLKEAETMFEAINAMIQEMKGLESNYPNIDLKEEIKNTIEAMI